MKKPTMKCKAGLWKVMHNKWATDRYFLGSTIVEAETRQAAMDKLNNYLATMPDGAFTSKPCESITLVSKLKVLM